MGTTALQQTECGPLPALPTDQTGIMSTMDSTGDTTVTWNKDSPDEVDNARATFNRLTKDNKFTAFKMDAQGKQGGKMTAFDPKAERIILVPQLVGG